MNLIHTLENQLESINAELSELPAGRLEVYKNDRWDRWFYINNNKREYIPKANLELAQNLAYKQYLSLKKEIILAKIESLSAASIELEYATNELNKFILNEKYIKLLNRNNSVTSKDISLWLNEPFNQNPAHKEKLIFRCPSGHYVRSKSEVFIDMALTNINLPFRYECELQIGNHLFYPDFTILHPYTNKLIYWEHLGMMDDDAYSGTAFSKLRTYQLNDIIIGENLIVSYESSKNPFSIFDAEETIKLFHLY